MKYYSKAEMLFARIFSRKTAWIIRIGIILGAIMAVIYATWVVENVPDWTWTDFTHMPGFWLWSEGFLQIGIPFLIIRHVIHFFNTDLDDAYNAWHAEHITLSDRLMPSPKLWKYFNPLDREYAEHYYQNRIIGSVNSHILTDKEIAGLAETNAEICYRIKVHNYKAICKSENRPFSYADADRAIYAEEHPVTVERTQEASDQYQSGLQTAARKNGWDGWKDDPSNPGPFVPNEEPTDKAKRLIAAGKISPFDE